MDLVSSGSLLWVVCPMLALLFATYGTNGMKMFFTAPYQTYLSEKDRNMQINIFKDAKIYAIVCGWLGVLEGAIMTLVYAVNSDKFPEEAIAPGCAISVLSLFYGYMIAYFSCYPV